MDFWHRARSLAEEAAKRSKELSIGPSTFSDLVSETVKRSKEIVAEASKRTEQIKRLADEISASSALAVIESPVGVQEKDLEEFGITEELREFVKEITVSTFQDFPLDDDTQISEVPTVSNVRQDLTEWQEKHANLVLLTVKEISKLRYDLCPLVMKERKFWRVYFILVNSHVAAYEKRYMENLKLKSTEQSNDGGKESTKGGIISKPEAKEVNQPIKTSSATEQDLDVFLLGDPGDSDEDPDDADGSFDDDFAKMVDSSWLEQD